MKRNIQINIKGAFGVLLLAGTLLGGSDIYAQTPTSFIIDTSQPAQTEDMTRVGYGGSNYSSTNTFNLRFGRNSDATVAPKPTLNSYVYNAKTFRPYVSYGDNPYMRIVVNRVPSPANPNPNKFTGFFEHDMSYGQGSTVPNNATVYFKAEYIDNHEELINSYVINRGVDNIFSNQGATANNAERIDMIIDQGIYIPAGIDMADMGLMIMDRGGNDNFKVAVITSITSFDGTGEVDGLGQLYSGGGNWSATGYNSDSVTTSVFQNGPAESQTELRPDQNLGGQSISGHHITLASLGVASGTTIYGISVFPNDVTNANDLIGLSDVPLDTDGTNQGGLDLMGGGSFFFQEDLTVATIGGSVLNDTNGNAVIDGTGIGQVGTEQLYAYLVDNGTIIAKVPVEPDGDFVFPSTPLDTTTTYEVIIDTRNINIAETSQYNHTSSLLPAGWSIVGEDFGTNNQAGDGIDPTPDLRISVQIDDDNPVVSGIKFGLNDRSYLITNPMVRQRTK